VGTQKPQTPRQTPKTGAGMTIYSIEGAPLTTDPEPPDPEDAAKPRYLRASPGRVLLVREKVNRFYDEAKQFEKHADVIESEERFNIHAQIVRVGPKLDRDPWFKKGDFVIVTPSLLKEVQLDDEKSVYVAPFSAVDAVWSDTDDE
jgi:hypothetical protein